MPGTLVLLPGAPGFSVLRWLLLGIERASENSVAGVGCGWLTIAISIALSTYAGFPETAYIDGLLAVVWSFWRMANVRAAFRYRFIINWRQVWSSACFCRRQS
jgi:hypothetical protein